MQVSSSLGQIESLNWLERCYRDAGKAEHIVGTSNSLKETDTGIAVTVIGKASLRVDQVVVVVDACGCAGDAHLVFVAACDRNTATTGKHREIARRAIPPHRL